MTDTLRDLLRRDADGVEIPTLDASHVMGQGERRLRRRRASAALAAVAVIAGIAIGGYVAGSAQQRSEAPVKQPHEQKTKGTDQNKASAPVTRKILYYDRAGAGNADGPANATVHYGNSVFDLGNSWYFMDVTDDGFVYGADVSESDPAKDFVLMFTDGGEPQKIATGVCGVNPGFAGTQVATANEGSLVTWFDCSGPPPAELVVFDTSLGREIARHRVPQCGNGFDFGCEPGAIIGDHVYFTGPYFLPSSSQVFEFDIPSDNLHRVKTVGGNENEIPYYLGYENAEPYLEDIRNYPRGLVVGDSWESSMPTSHGLGFAVVGTRLVPQSDWSDTNSAPTSAFDTATGHEVHLHVPEGYHGAPGFSIFEWLDDDTIAMIGTTGWDGGPGYGDILTCRLSNGRCVLTARGHGPIRVEANGDLFGN